MDQYRDPLQGAPRSRAGREADGCWEVGSGEGAESSGI